LEPYIYFENGRLHKPGYYDINYVTWWTLKHNGIGINSPKVSDLDIKVNWEDILSAMNYNLNSYWKSKLNKKIIFMLDSWVEFSILTLCRIVNTLENKEINSKLASANRTLNIINKEFNTIILEAIRIREGKDKKSLYRSKIKRSKDVKRFIESSIDYCNSKYNLENL
ncbi:aminoglycoside adenylyltransferase domain-containing protein, partial [Clostridium sp.]|uniref:aminoglycoside adenylyltransferase domain-containing protein n=1 Tax=Clostridium sp. TaxID=1506 RepID=UPI0034642891